MTYQILDRTYSFSQEQLEVAVKEGFSRADVLRKLNLRVAGANYAKLNRMIKELNLDISHWTGQGHLKGKTHNYAKKKSLQEILVKDSNYTGSNTLKKRLLKGGLLKYECSICFIKEWLGKELVLHLDHINGTSDDNRIENLRLLCPNCHSQTDTYTGKNKTHKNKLAKPELYICECGKEKDGSKSKGCEDCYKKRRAIDKHKILCACGNEMSYYSKTCVDCRLEFQRQQKGKPKPKTRKVPRPSKEELIELVKTTPLIRIAKKFGVSDNSIREWCICEGIEFKKEPGYWTKVRYGVMTQEGIEPSRPEDKIF